MKKIALFVFLFFFSIHLFASTLKISPTRIDLSQEQPIAIFEMTNADNQSVLIQSQIMRWTHQKNQDKYQPTQDILMVPPMFKLKPQQTQIVRFALRKKNDFNKEMSYRVFLMDLMQQPMHSRLFGQAVQMKLRIAIPIFVAPTIKDENRPQWQAKLMKNKMVQITLFNHHNTHLFVDRIQLLDEKNRAISNPIKTFNYIFPGEKQVWYIKLTTLPRFKSIIIIADDNGIRINGNATLYS